MIKEFDVTLRKELSTCRNCIYFCDQDSERPRISAWCGNDESGHYCLDIKDTDICKEYRRDGE